MADVYFKGSTPYVVLTYHDTYQARSFKGTTEPPKFSVSVLMGKTEADAFVAATTKRIQEALDKSDVKIKPAEIKKALKLKLKPALDENAEETGKFKLNLGQRETLPDRKTEKIQRENGTFDDNNPPTIKKAIVVFDADGNEADDYINFGKDSIVAVGFGGKISDAGAIVLHYETIQVCKAVPFERKQRDDGDVADNYGFQKYSDDDGEADDVPYSNAGF